MNERPTTNIILYNPISCAQTTRRRGNKIRGVNLDNFQGSKIIENVLFKFEIFKIGHFGSTKASRVLSYLGIYFLRLKKNR